MPLYTYVISYRGTTKVSQLRSSNYTGFMRGPVLDAFPNLKPHLGDIIRLRPSAVPNVEHAWGCEIIISGDKFVLHVVETRS